MLIAHYSLCFTTPSKQQAYDYVSDLFHAISYAEYLQIMLIPIDTEAKYTTILPHLCFGSEMFSLSND